MTKYKHIQDELAGADAMLLQAYDQAIIDGEKKEAREIGRIQRTVAAAWINLAELDNAGGEEKPVRIRGTLHMGPDGVYR